MALVTLSMYFVPLGSSLSRNRPKQLLGTRGKDDGNFSRAEQLAESLDEDTISAMHNVLKDIPVQRDGGFVPKWGENFTCRVWVKEALDALISFTSVNDLEQEAIRVAYCPAIGAGCCVAIPFGCYSWKMALDC